MHETYQWPSYLKRMGDDVINAPTIQLAAVGCARGTERLRPDRYSAVAVCI